MNVLPKNKMPRYERKYLISAKQAEHIRMRLDTLCFRDENLGSEDRYRIRSLYFDDYFGSSYYDNEIGIEPRSKFRIRIYNCDDSFISLEQKNKIGGKIYKDRAVISRDFVDAILRDEIDQVDYPGENPLINRFLTACHTKYLRPSVIVDYNREPYVYPDGDVRITIDSDISFADDVAGFYDNRLFAQPILPEGQVLLEVKYTEFIPNFIYQQLNNFNLRQCTFSKYYLCEKYRRMGEW